MSVSPEQFIQRIQGRLHLYRKRDREPVGKNRDNRTLQFSFQIIGQTVLPHNLRELENDLIGNFFETGQVIRPQDGKVSEGLWSNLPEGAGVPVQEYDRSLDLEYEKSP